MSAHRICRLEDLQDKGAQRFVVAGHRLAVVRIGEQVWAIGDRCSHQDVSLSEGEVDATTRHLECWKHGSSFSLETGRPDTLPATQPVPTYAVRIEGGDVLVEVPS